MGSRNERTGGTVTRYHDWSHSRRSDEMPVSSLNPLKMWLLLLLNTKIVWHNQCHALKKSSICITARWEQTQPNGLSTGVLHTMIYFQQIILSPLWPGGHILGHPLWYFDEWAHRTKSTHMWKMYKNCPNKEACQVKAGNCNEAQQQTR